MTAHSLIGWTTNSRIHASNLAFVRCRSPKRSALYGVYDIASEITRSRELPSQLRKHEFFVLDGVNLKLEKGEALGVIGPNGAGKSTLIKILAGLIKPTRGSVEFHGRIEAIIELGGGFDPFLSGRENAIIGGRLRQFEKGLVGDYMKEVERFAAIGEAFDAPVCTYSTGMQARVAFAMAAAAQPDILLVDEALAVGDHAFQRRCIRFINEMLSRGGSLVLVSHNNFQVQSLCQRGLVLADGRAIFEGTSVEAVRAMLDHSKSQAQADPGLPSNGHLRLLRFGDPSGGSVVSGGPAEVVVEYSLGHDHEDVSWGFEIWTLDEQICVTSSQDLRRRQLRAGTGTLRCTLNEFPLTAGSYVMKLNMADLLIVEPLILNGQGQSSHVIEVHASPSLVSNFQKERGQLINVQVAWD